MHNFTRKKIDPAIALILLFAAGFSLLAFLVMSNAVFPADMAIISFVQGFESPLFTTVMRFFTFIGSFPVVLGISVLILLLLFKLYKQKAELIVFMIVLVGSPLFNELLKRFFHRVRPEYHRLIDIGGFSFPSGHSMNAFSLYGILAFLLWRHIRSRAGRTALVLFSVFMILLIGLSRIYLGVHYPSDVLGGYTASGCWVAVVIWSFQKYKDKRKQQMKSGGD
ncbi:phosphatase PAP2 family protein [Fictibacillus enclensis]|uniref:phosphatase PAP2 family protein n=2 Tax=Fictibacillus enclensis TaxID=1017270 RepID=UPI0025A27E80|nr:phosphatase PAP2 family protein [Fictibacillus enclensis]MDM5335863.1 phosphatase PAP2 family protein [Fictibacillus enclensis]